MAGKMKYLWIFVFLLFMPMAFSDDLYYALITADNYTEQSSRCDGGSEPLCYIDKIIDNGGDQDVFMMYSNSSWNTSIQRANVQWALWSPLGTDVGGNVNSFGQMFNGYQIPSTYNNSWFTNATSVSTPYEEDWGKRASVFITTAGNNFAGGKYTITFNNVTGNTDNLGWCEIIGEVGGGTSNAYYTTPTTYLQGEWECRTNGVYDGFGEETNPPKDNPLKLYVIAGSGDNYQKIRVLWLHFPNITTNFEWVSAFDNDPHGEIYNTYGVGGARSCTGTGGCSWVDEWVDNTSCGDCIMRQATAFILKATDNYTKTGYEQNTINNFSYSMTNGSTTLSGTADGDFIISMDIEGLWNISVWKDSPDEYTNRTYENYNVSTDLTAYLYQTHFHEDLECHDCVKLTGTTSGSPQAVSFSAICDTNCIVRHKSGTNNRLIAWMNMLGNGTGDSVNLSYANSTYLKIYMYNYYFGGSSGGGRSSTSGVNCTTDANGVTYNYNFSVYVGVGWGSAFPSCSYHPEGTSWSDSIGLKTLPFNNGVGYPHDALYFMQYNNENSNNEYDNFYGTAGTTPAYISVDYFSNFTIAVIDGFSKEPVYNTTVNISNGAWSIQDTYTGIHRKAYGFDEGVYTITVTTESGLTTHTESSYDLATNSNYLIIEIASTEYAIFNLTVYDETTETIINENITINAIGTEYSEERTITTGNWYDITENFKPEEYWFSALGTAGTNGSDWDFRTYYIDFIDVGTGTNTFYMYLLNDTLTGEICINVYDNSGSAISNAYIELLRHYPANNSYKTVQISRTDNNGYATLIAVPDTVVYKYLVKTSLSASASYTSDPAYLSDSACYNIYLTTGAPVGVEWFNSQGVDYSYYYSEPTTSMNYLWDDPNNNVATACLKTYRMGIFRSLIDESCESSAAGQISHTVDNTTEATYTSYMYVTMAADTDYQIFIGTFSHTIDLQTAEVIGTLGLFLVILAILTIGLAGIWNGGVAVMLTGVAILLSQATGIILLNFVWTIGIIAVGVIIIILNKD